jgi:HK97 family phage prohead protease
MLLRSVSFETRDASTPGDGLTLDGYAAVFNSPTRINSWEGTFDETIAPGAFKKSMRERTPVLQVNHGRSEDLPIGAIESLTEDAKGLHVTARIFDVPDTALLREGIKAQAIHGMSFRFEVVKDEWRDAAGNLVPTDHVSNRLYASDPTDPTTILQRTLREVKLYELGPVTYPAYGDTSVSLRSREAAALLTDPQVRAEVARLLAGTPSESSEDEGSSDEGRAATPTEEPPQALPARIPSPEARARALALEGVLSHG